MSGLFRVDDEYAVHARCAVDDAVSVNRNGLDVVRIDEHVGGIEALHPDSVHNHEWDHTVEIGLVIAGAAFDDEAGYTACQVVGQAGICPLSIP